MANNYDAEKQEAQKRFEALPEKLKKEMLADKNVQLISNICQDYNIPEDQVKIVAMIVGEVFLGYMKPEEIASELNQHFQIDMQKANFIEIELKQKLFNGLKADLDKIYNPPKNTEETQAEEAPKIVNFEPLGDASSSAGLPPSPPANGFGRTSRTGEQDKKEAASLSSITSQPAPAALKIPTMGTGTASIINQRLTTNNQQQKSSNVSKTTPEPVMTEMPFIIQTKTETARPTIAPQSSKESLSLNLKVEPSLANKPIIAKPVSVRLETEQKNNVKFTMPVIVNQRPTTNNQQPTTNDKQQMLQQKETVIPGPTRNPEKKTGIQINFGMTEESGKDAKANMSASPALKQISEQAPSATLGTSQGKPISELKPTEEPIPSANSGQVKTVHYSNFKTPLTPSGTPKKPESKKEDYINLSTFTKVSGNTVDLRNDKRPTTNN